MAHCPAWPQGQFFIAACARVCRVVRVPVSVDIERGCGRGTDELVRTRAAAGVAGEFLYAGYPGVPPVAALAAAGVRRISLGCGPLRSALGLLGRMAAEH